jgi:hypothetical protein
VAVALAIVVIQKQLETELVEAIHLLFVLHQPAVVAVEVVVTD